MTKMHNNQWQSANHNGPVIFVKCNFATNNTSGYVQQFTIHDNNQLDDSTMTARLL
jgi:hypothetical protein